LAIDESQVGIRECGYASDRLRIAARAIILGQVDVGPGLRAVAAAWGLDFVPLAIERYDLAMPRSVLVSNRFKPLRASLRSRSFRRQAATLPGYDLRDSGRIVGHAGSDGHGI
jgi:putative molybdopterin biosynthesis protein